MKINIVIILSLLLFNFSLADDNDGDWHSSVTCPNADIWGTKLIDQICWSCLLPINIMGVGSQDGVPNDANDDSFCSCVHGDEIQTIEIGVSIGFWEPYRLVEVVRTPYCTPSLGGTIMEDSLMIGNGKSNHSNDLDGKIFYHYHWFSFPLLQILELMTGKCSEGMSNLDLMYMSELDPVWNDDPLSFFTNPEVALFSNPLLQAACVGDCTAATAGHPLQNLYWCAGCWGSLYPFTGNIATTSSPPRESSLILTKALAGLHRRGLVKRQVGTDNLCHGSFFPMLPKSDYRVSMLFPIAEATKPCCHAIGASTFSWGEWRNIPGQGEDFVYLLWRYNDCCLR